MCGLIYCRSLDNIPAGKRVIKRYNQQKSRGQSGFGFVGFSNPVETYQRFSSEEKLIETLKKDKSKEILFHHRKPTSTPNLPEQAHPIMIKTPKIKNIFYVIHNGVISNAYDLKTEHQKRGLVYSTEMTEQTIWQVGKSIYKTEKTTSFNDSEAFAFDLALYLSGKSKVIKSNGSIAFICLETTKRGRPLAIHFGRGSNPLVLEQNKNLLVLKSEGSGKQLTPNKIFTYDYKTKETTEKFCDLGFIENNLGFCDYNYQSRTDYWWKKDEIKTVDEIEEKELELDELKVELDLYKENSMYVEAEAINAEIRKLEKEIEMLYEKDIESIYGI